MFSTHSVLTQHLSQPLPSELPPAEALGWTAASSAPAAISPADAEPVDMARLREVADDDPAGVRELVDMYLAEWLN